MMILVGVTVSVVMQGGLFDKATIAVIKQETATMQEYIVTKGADMLADKAKDGDELNVTVEEILQAYGMTLTEINFEETPDYISNVDVDPEGTCYLLDASKLHVNSSRGNGTAQTGKDIFVVDSNKRVYYVIEGKTGQGGDIPPDDILGEIPEYDIAKIYAVEDLVELTIKVNNGTFENEYKTAYPEASEIVVTLERDLNFADPNSYRTQDPANKEYTDAEGNKVDANGDGTVESIMTEMIGTTVEEADGTETRTGLGFKPIGIMVGFDEDTEMPIMNSFTGTFDGKENTISNLYINRPEEMTVGLFGTIDSGTNIQNLELTGNITGNLETSYAAGIVGAAIGEIKINNCHATDVKVNGMMCGGIAGVIQGEKVNVSECTGDTIEVNGTNAAAGIICTIMGKEIDLTNCTNKNSTVRGDSGGAGIICVAMGIDETSIANITNCDIEGGTITYSKHDGESQWFGGILMQADEIELRVDSCDNKDGTIKSARGPIGGIIGRISEGNGISITNCTSSGKIEGDNSSSEIGGILGDGATDNDIIIENCSNNSDINAGGAEYIGGIAGLLYTTGEVKINNCRNYKTIDASEAEYTGTVTGIAYIRGSYGEYAEKVEITNCINNGEILTDVRNTYGIASICPTAFYVDNCVNTGSIIGDNDAMSIAGIVGVGCDSESIISNCINKGNLSGKVENSNYTYTAVGIASGGGDLIKIINCFNEGDISAEQTAGISLGSVDSIYNCYNTGDLSGTEVASGIHYVDSSEGEIKNCYNVGTITSASAETAYDIGNTTNITNCHALTGNEDATAKEALKNALNTNRDDTTTWSEWTIVKGVNNGYPIFTWQNVTE